MNELAKKDEPFKLKTAPIGLAARKAAAISRGDVPDTQIIKVEQCEHRIGIVFDDSGSMWEQMDNAQKGVEEFLRSCKPNNTAVAIYPMCQAPLPLTIDLPALSIMVKSIRATGSTPLFATLRKILDLNITRAIAFSDGQADDTASFDDIVAKAKKKNVAVDTVFLGIDSGLEYSGAATMRRLAEATGGIYLCFDPNKMNFRDSFKYLSPGYRAMLADKSFIEKLQEGKI